MENRVAEKCDADQRGQEAEKVRSMRKRKTWLKLTLSRHQWEFKVGKIKIGSGKAAKRTA